jgi:hypothetical protein
MNVQRDLFNHRCAHVQARQEELFAPGEDERSNVPCGEFGEHLVRTPSGYLACPNGHGKLTCEEEPGEQSYGTWFEDEL